jgi:hypothetical protein
LAFHDDDYDDRRRERKRWHLLRSSSHRARSSFPA